MSILSQQDTHISQPDENQASRYTLAEHLCLQHRTVVFVTRLSILVLIPYSLANWLSLDSTP